MRKIVFLSIVQMLVIKLTFAQVSKNYDVADLNGIWHNEGDTANFNVYKDGHFINMFYRNNTTFYFDSVEKCGFISLIDSTDNIVKNNGSPEKDWFYWGGILYRFDLENPTKIHGKMELISSNVFHFTKKERLPSVFIKGLIKQGIKDHRNYIKEFLNINLFFIENSKSIIYNNLFHPSINYLVRGDLVQILKRKGMWIRIRYYGSKTIEGWIKSSTVKQ